MERVRAWAFTLNNYNEDDEKRMNSVECEYIIYGKEIGKEGTPHFQGYIKFKHAKTLKSVKKILGDRAHLEVARGSPQQNYEYCSKQGNFITRGELPRCKAEGGRMEQDRWEAARMAALEGRYEDIPADIYIRYQSSLKRIRMEDQPKPKDLKTMEYYGLWLWGKPRVGKSHYVRTTFPEAYNKGKNKWWDKYTGQKHVVIDEMQPEHNWMADALKEWADKWTFTGEIKGGRIEARPELIIITSNYRIDQIFTRKEDYEAIKARFEEREFTIDQRL